jgi:2-hydroxy-3-oxopropionate reductase
MKIGFIGLGVMGKPMSKNLIKAGYALVVYDINAQAAGELAAAGAQAAGSIAELARECGVIVTMLPNSPQVKDVLLGEKGVIAHGKAGALIIDMSSIAPAAAVECGAAARAAGLRMIDAPVSGGEPKAIEGTLSIMCGGEKKDFDEAYPILMKMGASAVLCGGIGAGNTTKLCNQIIVGANIAAMSEALTLAVKAGVDPQVVFQAIRGGLAGSTVLDAKAPMVLKRNFKPGFRIDLHIKDLGNAMDTAKAAGSPAPLTTQVLEMMKELSGRGEGQADHSALAKYYEALAGITIEPRA